MHTYAHVNRATADTKMNDESSRSHLVLMVRVCATHRHSGEQSVGRLVLIDLAGNVHAHTHTHTCMCECICVHTHTYAHIN